MMGISLNYKKRGKKIKQSLKVSSLTVMCACFFSTSGYASHGSYNPMMPRQLSEKSAQADYSYGYSILSGNAIDSLEAPNRMMWYVNYNLLDRYILRPVAHTYALLPKDFQKGVGNFFSNLEEVNNIPNNLLVGRPKEAGVSSARLVVNSTIGFLGFFDVASQMGLTAAPMDMQTVLGKAGANQGAFIMIPGYGPGTARDFSGDTIDGLPWIFLSWPIAITKYAISGVHTRAQLIDQEALVDNALDPYVQTRDAFLMHDENKVNPVAEGEVEAEDNFDEDLLDEIDS